jgi:hypothetical protein
MKKAVFVAVISAFFAGGCAIGFVGHHRGESLMIVPALPVTVEIDADQYYSQNGYFYRYQGNAWVYSQSRQGPWSDLPRSRYPRQVRSRGQINHDNNNGGLEKRDRDNRDHDNQQHDR